MPEEDRRALALQDNSVPREIQLRLFEDLATPDEEMTRALDVYDTIPKYLLGHARRESAPRVLVFDDVRIGGAVVKVTITPAMIIPRGTGNLPIQGARPAIIFPGPREDLIERALRKLAVDHASEMGIKASEDGTPTYYISIPFTISKLRRRLKEDGHAFKISEIREGLDVMRKCHLSIEGNVSVDYVRESGAPLLTIPDQFWARSADTNGERSLIIATFHPLATHAILSQSHYPMSHTRLMRLRLPLARWIATRVIIRFRQARKGGHLADPSGYKLTLNRVLAESGITRKSRVRDNIVDVRAALKELTAEGFLAPFSPPVEHPIYVEPVRRLVGSTKRPRRVVVDMSWQIYPSNAVVEEIIQGNLERKHRPLRGPME